MKNMLKNVHPLVWPIGHIVTALSGTIKPVPNAARSGFLTDFLPHITLILAGLRSMAMAYCAMYVLHSPESPYPAFGAAANGFSLSWALPILIRNILGAWTICGFWDWFLYFSPMAEGMKKYKMNPVIPTTRQILHDALHTTIATICGSAIEIALCMGWASGAIATPYADNNVVTLLGGAFLLQWRVPHFYVVHRMMHPWRKSYIPDIGKFLYRHVHSLHHKSYNPTAFSGTSMHPVEATLYYSAALIPVAVGLHPIVAVACIIDCGVGAWLGHDGFQWPGCGDYFHQLHHTHFDCNYGNGVPFLPLDWFFGSDIYSAEDLKRVWGKDGKVGDKHNETGVHAAPSAKKK